jgi:hypothetical protein
VPNTSTLQICGLFKTKWWTSWPSGHGKSSTLGAERSLLIFNSIDLSFVHRRGTCSGKSAKTSKPSYIIITMSWIFDYPPPRGGTTAEVELQERRRLHHLPRNCVSRPSAFSTGASSAIATFRRRWVSLASARQRTAC